MATDGILKTYEDTSIKPDVVGVIEILTARETWFLGNLGKRTAYNVVHQTQVDTLRTPASAAVKQGVDYTLLDRTTPDFLTNIVEEVQIPFGVTAAQQRSAHFSGENELARQTQKALKDWGNASEFDLVRSTLTSGASGTTAKMSGIVEAVSKSTNTTAHNSGTVLSASIINGLMKDAVDNSNGNVAYETFMGSFLRNVVDGFTQKSNSLVSVDAHTIDNMVDMYQTSFGRIALHYHRYVHQSGDSTGRVLSVNPETLKIAYLEKPFVDTNIARTGNYTKRAVVGQLTLEVKNQDNNWWANGFDID